MGKACCHNAAALPVQNVPIQFFHAITQMCVHYKYVVYQNCNTPAQPLAHNYYHLLLLKRNVALLQPMHPMKQHCGNMYAVHSIHQGLALPNTKSGHFDHSLRAPCGFDDHVVGLFQPCKNHSCLECFLHLFLELVLIILLTLCVVCGMLKVKERWVL